jgi:hypothetical protein
MRKEKMTPKQIIVLIILILIILSFSWVIYNFYKEDMSFNANVIKSVRPKITSVDAKAIAYLLSDIGAGKLHKNTLGFEKPIICIKTEKKDYLCTISKTIDVKEQNCSKQDINIKTTNQEILNALSGNVKTYIKDSVLNEKTEVELVAGEIELFAKGYMEIYDGFR